MIKTCLIVPFKDKDKDEAKRLGAWWDAKARLWYCDQSDEAKFNKWSVTSNNLKPRTEKPQKQVMSKPGVKTARTDFSLPDCGCLHVPPWEHCEHSEPALDGAELEHMRSI